MFISKVEKDDLFFRIALLERELSKIKFQPMERRVSKAKPVPTIKREEPPVVEPKPKKRKPWSAEQRARQSVIQSERMKKLWASRWAEKEAAK
jgi:hypothetical protein